MEIWSVVVAVLVAVLAGAAIPLLFQLWITVRSARNVAERLDRITARLEEGQRVDELVTAIDSLSRAARQIGDGVKIASAIGAALGPAAAAALHAWQASRASGDERRGGEGPARAGPRPEADSATPSATGAPEERRKVAG